MSRFSQLCKLRYYVRGLRLVLLAYLCLIQCAAPLVHAHSVSDSSQPQGLHYIHSTGVPPSTLASQLNSTCENIEIAVAELNLESHTIHPIVLPAVYPSLLHFVGSTRLAIPISQAIYQPAAFYYSCSPRSPPQGDTV